MMTRNFKFKDFLKRSKIPIEIEDSIKYKRVKIRIKHGGVSLRDEELGKNIGTKKQFILKDGQFVLSKIDARYGAFGIADESVNNAIITGNFWAYDVDFNLIDIDWFNQLTNSQDFYDLCERSSTGITHRKYLNEAAFLNNEINLPSLEDQKRSVKRIENFKFNGKLNSSELKNQLSLISQLRQAFLKEAMQGTLVSNETSDGKTGAHLLAEIQTEKEKLIKEKRLKKGKITKNAKSTTALNIPQNWKFAKFDDLFFVTKLAGFEYSDHMHLSQSGEIPVIRAQNVRNLEITKSNLLYIDLKTSLLLDRCSLNKECLLITFIGAGIGDVATFNEDTRWHLAPNVAKAEPFLGIEDLYSIKYFNYFLISQYGKFEIVKHMKATAQPSLSMETIRDIDIPLPPLEIQNRIVTKLEELMIYCDELETSVKESQNYNEQLLQQVLREALEVKEVAGEVK